MKLRTTSLASTFFCLELLRVTFLALLRESSGAVCYCEKIYFSSFSMVPELLVFSWSVYRD